MNGAHDLGGQMGLGPINPKADEPVFHAAWERRAFAVSIAAGAMGHWSIDHTRFARENREQRDYLGSSYYEVWIKGLEVLLRQHGFVSEAEIAAGTPIESAPVPRRILRAEAVPALVRNGSPYNRPPSTEPAFDVGDRVRTKNMNPTGHTRLPRYARGKVGTIASRHGGFVFADENARTGNGPAEHLYTVTFAATELWGRDDGDPRSEVSIEAWESYLEPA